MRVLIIKTSSLGDVVHALPALTDARAAIPGITFDWVVEESFAPIPSWHKAVVQVIPVALRRWRKSPLSKKTRSEWHDFKHRLTATDYDLVIDAQGLLKSAALTRMARGEKHGLNRRSAREGLASLNYDVTHQVNKNQHAIDRLRLLFSQALGYQLSPEALNTQPDYGIFNQAHEAQSKQLVFLHGTTWQSKHWPESYWQDLTEFATHNNYQVQLPWGSDAERERAERLAERNDQVHVTAAMDLNGLAELLASSAGAVAVDTGLGHLAAALALPTVSLYGATNPDLTGTRGKFQMQLSVDFPCAPCLKRDCKYKKESPVIPACYQSLQPAQVWHNLQQLMISKGTDK